MLLGRRWNCKAGGTPFTFGLTATGSSPIPLALSGSGVLSGGALNSVAGNNTYAGPISVGLGSGGATIASTSTAPGDQLTLSGGVCVAQGAVLSFIGPGNTTINGSGPMLAAATAADGNASLAMQGPGTLEIDAAPTLGDGSALVVSGGTLRFNITAGAATVGVGVTATVSSGGVLELAGSVPALSAGGNQVNIVNNSIRPRRAVWSRARTNRSARSPAPEYRRRRRRNVAAYQIRQNSLTIGSGATVTLAPSGSGSTTTPAGPNNINFSSTLTSLSIAGTTNAWTGKLDIGNNGLVIAYGSGPDPYSTIDNMIASGYNGGVWGGTGITSSLAQAGVAQHISTPLNIGLVDFTPGTGNYTNTTFIVFEGQTVTTNAILVRLTYMDDLVLAGDMPANNATSDALLFAANYGIGTTWGCRRFGRMTAARSTPATPFCSPPIIMVGLPSLDGTIGGNAATIERQRGGRSGAIRPANGRAGHHGIALSAIALAGDTFSSPRCLRSGDRPTNASPEAVCIGPAFMLL